MSGLLNINRQILFIHVPKTAGTSIEKLPWVHTAGHNPVWTYPDKLREQLEFSFAFTRHPQDRFMSAATAGFLIGGYPPYDPKPNNLPFTELKKRITIVINNIYSAQKGKEFNPERKFQMIGRFPDPYPHFIGWNYKVHYYPMWFFLTDQGNKIGVDFVGKYESLARDWEIACEKMGLEHEILPHHRNAALYRAPLRDYYTKDTARMIADLYQKDFEIFDYEVYE